jgi:hypothetical protein
MTTPLEIALDASDAANDAANSAYDNFLDANVLYRACKAYHPHSADLRAASDALNVAIHDLRDASDAVIAAGGEKPLYDLRTSVTL